MMKKIVSLSVLFTSLMLTQMSCFKDPPSLNREDRKVVDSLYNAQRKARAIELDSICDVTFDKRVAATFDSIMMKRLEEIRRLKGE